jgi:uncharacterized protein
MLFNRIVGVLVFSLSLAVFSLPRVVLADDDVYKVVYHADFAEPARFSAMLQNIFNMTTTYENGMMDYDIRIVFLSKGIRFLTRNNLKGTPFEADKAFLKQREDFFSRLKSLREIRGVKFELCKITKDAVKLEDNELIPGVTMVVSGVVQIAKLQREGFSYLKVE